MATKSTKRGLIISAMAILVCFTMLLGTTYAWFTDSVTSAGNIIKTGSLNVTLEYKKVGEAADAWKDASAGAIFEYQYWEPGYTEVRYVKIENEGSLDLKFKLNIIPAQTPAAGEVNLADVIDVYMIAGEYAVTREALAATDPVGTLASLMADPDGAAYGELLAPDNGNTTDVSEIYTIVLKMQETAGNEYQEKTVGGSFIVQLLATQLASESDDLGNDYDEDSDAIVYDKATMGDLYTYLQTMTSGSTLILPEGTYNTTGTFLIPAGVTIKGELGKEVVIHQSSSAQDDIFNCAGDVTIENITFESNRKGYAVAGNTKAHDTDGDITIRNCKFVGVATEKNWGVYKNLNGDLTLENCTFDNYNNAVCGVNNGNGSTTTITGCTFTNINGEAIGYVSSTLPADFEANVIADNTGLTEANVIGY